MTPNDLLFLGLKNRVSAITKSDGNILWTTQLAGVLGDGFVTVNCDGKHVYAYAKGQLHCLELFSGQILWTNQLKGFGYGVASICIPGCPTAPDPAIYAKMEADRRSQNAAATSSNAT